MSIRSSLSKGSNTSQHQDTPLHTSKLRAGTFRGIQMPYKVGIRGELSKLNRPYEKLKSVSLPPILSQLPIRLRAKELNCTRKRRNPCPHYLSAGGPQERISLLLRSMGRNLTGTRVPKSTYPPSEQPVPREGQKQGVVSRHHRSPSVMELGHPGPPALRIGGSSKKGCFPSVSTPFRG